MLVAWRAETREEEPLDLAAQLAGSAVTAVAGTAAFAAAGASVEPTERRGDRLLNLIPEQRTRLPLLDDRSRRAGLCGNAELVGRVAS
jgi:hypothetical protein